jgi:hypothetical protein
MREVNETGSRRYVLLKYKRQHNKRNREKKRTLGVRASSSSPLCFSSLWLRVTGPVLVVRGTRSRVASRVLLCVAVVVMDAF